MGPANYTTSVGRDLVKKFCESGQAMFPFHRNKRHIHSAFRSNLLSTEKKAAYLLLRIIYQYFIYN